MHVGNFTIHHDLPVGQLEASGEVFTEAGEVIARVVCAVPDIGVSGQATDAFLRWEHNGGWLLNAGSRFRRPDTPEGLKELLDEVETEVARCAAIARLQQAPVAAAVLERRTILSAWKGRMRLREKDVDPRRADSSTDWRADPDILGE